MSNFTYNHSNTFDVEVTENINTLMFTDSELAADFTEYVQHEYDIQMLCKVNFANLFADIPIPAHMIRPDGTTVTADHWRVADPEEDGSGADIDQGYKPFARRLRNVLVNGDLVHTRGYYEVYEDEKKIYDYHKNLVDLHAAAAIAKKKAEQEYDDAVAALQDAEDQRDLLQAQINEATMKRDSLLPGSEEYNEVHAEYTKLYDEWSDVNGRIGVATTGSETGLNMTKAQKQSALTNATNDESDKSDAAAGPHILREGKESGLTSEDIINKLRDKVLTRANQPFNLEYVNDAEQIRRTVHPVDPVDPSGEDYYWYQKFSVEEILRSAIQATNPYKYQASDKAYDASDSNPRLLPSTDIQRVHLASGVAALRVDQDIKMENIDKTVSFMQRPKRSAADSNAQVWNGAFFTAEQAGEVLHKLWEYETELRRQYREFVQQESGTGSWPLDILQAQNSGTIPAYKPRLEFVAHDAGGNSYSRFDASGTVNIINDASGTIPVDYDSLANMSSDLIRHGKFQPTGFVQGDKIASVLDLKIMHGDRTGDTQNQTVNVDLYRVKVVLQHQVSIPAGKLWHWDTDKLVSKPEELCYPSTKEERAVGTFTAQAGSYLFKQYDHAYRIQAAKDSGAVVSSGAY